MIEFLSYADIHHDDYHNGISLDDCIKIEDQITQYAVINKIKYVIFAGDWYRATNPLQSVIKAAEASWKRRSDAGIITIAMPGNHDRFTRSQMSGHAFGAVDIFNNDLKNVVVVDEARRMKLEDIDFMFIPAGYLHNLSGPKSHVVVFHDMLTGSMLASGGSAHHIDAITLSQLGSHLIIGGDNHTPQDLTPLLGVTGLYLGAPLQHNWGDKGQIRGFWRFTVDCSGVRMDMVEVGGPRFIKIKVDATNDVETLCKCITALSNELGNSAGIIEITLIGKNAPNINIQWLDQQICSTFKVRSLRISIDRIWDKLEVIRGITELKTPEDKWGAYIGATDVGSLVPTKLLDMGRWAIMEARKL